jgi:hypothetical protein
MAGSAPTGSRGPGDDTSEEATQTWEIAVEDVTEAFSCQILTGPKSREILSGITDADLSKAWLTHQSAQVDGTWCQLVRVSFAGELGWEIHSKTEDTPKIFDAVMKAGEPHGLKPFGMFALNSLRLEKGYRAWKGDLSTDYTVLQGGLDRFVKWDKPDFLGKQALEAEKQQGVSKRFVALIVEAGDCDAPYMSTLWHEGTVVGETTSGGWGTVSTDRSRSAWCGPTSPNPAPGWKSRSSVNALPPRLSRISRCGIPRTKDCGHECDCSSKCPRGHHRRRCLRLLGRLSSGQARLDRHRAAGTQAADLRHDLACRRADRAVARPQNMTRLAKYSADLYVKLEEETGVATGMRQVRLDLSSALTEDRRKELLRQATLARAFDVDVQEIGRRGQGDVSASQHLRRHLRRAPARRRPMRPCQHRHGAGQGRTAAGCADHRGREGHLGHHRWKARVTGVDWEQGGETARLLPISSSIAAACGAAILPRNRA